MDILFFPMSIWIKLISGTILSEILFCKIPSAQCSVLQLIVMLITYICWNWRNLRLHQPEHWWSKSFLFNLPEWNVKMHPIKCWKWDYLHFRGVFISWINIPQIFGMSYWNWLEKNSDPEFCEGLFEIFVDLQKFLMSMSQHKVETKETFPHSIDWAHCCCCHCLTLRTHGDKKYFGEAFAENIIQ